MEGKAKLGWGVLRIIGAIYATLGGMFFAMGLFFLALLPGEVRLVGMLFSVIGGIFLILGLIFWLLNAKDSVKWTLWWKQDTSSGRRSWTAC